MVDMASRNAGQDQCADAGSLPALAKGFGRHREHLAAIHYPLYWLTKRCTADLEAQKTAQNGWLDALDAGRLGGNRSSRDAALATADRIVAYLNANSTPSAAEEQARHDYAARVHELTEALALILPLAKGYAAAHPVGSNAAHVAHAESMITCATCDGRTIRTGPFGRTDCIACNPPLGMD